MFQMIFIPKKIAIDLSTCNANHIKPPPARTGNVPNFKAPAA